MLLGHGLLYAQGMPTMVDSYDDGRKNGVEERLKPSNIKKKTKKRQTAIALQESDALGDAPIVTAAGRGVLAENILQMAFENGINVREDSALAEMLASIELDSPIPSEAFMAVADVLSYVYRANGKPNPYDVRLIDDKDEE
jgi:flagellar biosynthesis protein